MRKHSPVHRVIAEVCPHCDHPRTFVIDYVHTVLDEQPPEEYTFCHCEICRRPIVVLREDMGDGFENDRYYRLYPSQCRHLGFALPEIVRSSYEEAVRCESGKTCMACVVMVGRTLEAVCKEFDPSAKSIFDGLRAMHANGQISTELLDWATELRVLRNIGAHATIKKVQLHDATGALDFLQAILEILYDLRPRFQHFKARRDGSVTKAAQPGATDNPDGAQ